MMWCKKLYVDNGKEKNVYILQQCCVKDAQGLAAGSHTLPASKHAGCGL